MPDDLRRQIPNILTLGRVALALAFFAVLTPWRYTASSLASGVSPDWSLVAATLLFTAGAVTDALDGHLARKWNVVSVFGRIMDPFADKLLVIGGFMYLAGPGFRDAAGGPVSWVAPWMVVVILARELLVTSIRAAFESRGVSFAATPSGKWKMILQSVCIPAVLILINLSGTALAKPTADMAIRILILSTVAITAWSGLPYIARAISSSQPKAPTA